MFYYIILIIHWSLRLPSWRWRLPVSRHHCAQDCKKGKTISTSEETCHCLHPRRSIQIWCQNLVSGSSSSGCRRCYYGDIELQSRAVWFPFRRTR